MKYAYAIPDPSGVFEIFDLHGARRRWVAGAWRPVDGCNTEDEAIFVAAQDAMFAAIQVLNSCGVSQAEVN